MNNITVDGSSFNNSFGLGGQPGDRTGVAAISLEALEQIQVNVAPFDVRQGSFIGAGVNSVTRSGTNRLIGVGLPPLQRSGMGRHRSPRANGQSRHVHVPEHRRLSGGPDRPEQAVRLHQLRRPVGQAAVDHLPIERRRRAGRRTGDAGPGLGPLGPERVPQLPVRLRHRAVRRHRRRDPGQALPGSQRLQPEQLQQDHVPLQPPQLVHRRRPVELRLGIAGPHRGQHQLPQLPELQLQDPREHPVGHRRMEHGHRRQHVESVPDRLHLPGRKPRLRGASSFPFVDIFEGGANYTSFGFEPFTVNNELRYKTFQVQDNFTKFATRHSITAGAYAEKYHSDNVFFGCCPQSAYSYNSLADFYADANDALANPNRTASPVTLRALPGALGQHPRAREARAAARRLVWRRLSAGRVAAAHERDGHGRRAGRCLELQEHRLSQPRRRRPVVPRRSRLAHPVRHRRDARARNFCGRRAWA